MSSQVGLWVALWWKPTLILALGVPHYQRDCFSLVVRDSSQLTSESLSLFVAEGLLSRCDILGDYTLVVPGESASVLAGEPLHHFVHWLLFLLQPRAPVKLQQ